jgi:PadR family transcriptional regulator PadR
VRNYPQLNSIRYKNGRERRSIPDSNSGVFANKLSFPQQRSPLLDKFLLPVYIDSMSTVDSLSDDEKLELLQGTLEVLILRSVKLEPNHAYGISQFLQQQSDREFLVDNGSLYPALQRLLQRKWIAGQWKISPNGRRARYYSLTSAGRKELLRATSKWERFALAMAKILAPEG